MPEVAGSIPARSISKPLLSRRFPLRCHYPPTGSDARSTPERPALASSQARIAALESRARWPYVWSITTDVPISCANSKRDAGGKRLGRERVSRRYGLRCTIAAARSTTASRNSKRSASATTARREGEGLRRDSEPCPPSPARRKLGRSSGGGNGGGRGVPSVSGTWLRSRILRFTLQQCRRRLEQPDAAVQHEREKRDSTSESTRHPGEQP